MLKNIAVSMLIIHQKHLLITCGTIITYHSLENNFRKYDTVFAVKSKDYTCLVTPNSMPRVCKYFISYPPESNLCTLAGINSVKPVDLKALKQEFSK